ncbi:hypothetical protein Acr_00g0099270 [Actinidia rufa]|uniref:Reverse transcriptase RNase H-like domain-containing protein n=1 Tax=Actinidia rufa TaxID=165716 RepID=A0A7J0E059_9ERIC|nr:hypothetical protein Acr_00g0099270 [Actinidia rufa]
MEPRQVISTELTRATVGVLISSPRARVLSPPRPWARGVLSGLAPALYFCSSVQVALQASEAQCRGDRETLTVSCSPRFLPQQFGAVCGNDSSRSSMHLLSRNLPKPSASSPLVTDPIQGLHCEIHDMAEHMRIMNENNGRLMQLLAAANPSLPAAPPVPNIERSRHSNRSGDRSQNVSANRVGRGRRQAPSSSLREKSSSESSKTPTRQTEPPFTRRVLRARISSKFKLPTQLGTYEGKTDLMDHLDSYKSLMLLQGCSDEVMCKAFSATLKGPARSWFRKLSPGTIDSFGDLSRLFVANFMSCRNRQKNASHLFTVHKKETESLKDFVKRFNQAILEVEDPSDKVIIMAMMEGLRPGPLFDSLSKNVPETLSALQSKADKYIAVEELAEAKRRQRGKDDYKRKEPDTRRNDYREENKHEEFVKWPGKIKTDPQKRNMNKYCEFYRDHGHNTANCFQLKEQIANFIKRGYLRKYVSDRPSPNSPERRYSDNRPTAGNIQTIHGGFGSGGCSTSSRKRHARSAFRLAKEEIYNLSSPYVSDQPAITFGNDDLRGLHLPHDDALVVSAVIANFNVQRILIDNGSSADILFISAFERMKVGLDKLHPFHTPLIGFGGNTTHPLGWINLPITLGTELHQNHRDMGDDTEMLRDEVEQLTLADPRETNNTKPLEEVVPISIHPDYPNRHIMIGTELTDELRFALVNFLKKNYDVFAWSQGDVPGIDPEIAMHKLFTNPESSPVRQKRRKFAPERLKVIEDEVDKLIRANVVREAHYPDWLANVVVAPKKGGKWRLKEYLGSPPLLTVPTIGEDLYIYLSISPIAIKKLAYALMIAARKLRHYFQAHPIIVLTDQPLKHILQRPNTSGRLLKWSIELSEFHIEYKPRTAIKAEALADFIVESTHEDTPQPGTAPPETGIPKEPTSEKDLAH